MGRGTNQEQEKHIGRGGPERRMEPWEVRKRRREQV
jgi:hypothetical protein